MTNLVAEITWIVVGLITIFIVFEKNHIHEGWEIRYNNFRILYYLSFIISCLVIEFSKRGAMYFGDGFDYYNIALKIIEGSNFNIKDLMNFKLFRSAAQSWHFVPVWEFTVFELLFSSTKCISIFHVILMHISMVVWYKFFVRLNMVGSGIMACIIMTTSLYVKNFTIPALKDALIFFLFTILCYQMLLFYQKNKLKNILYMLLPLAILTFTRMYTAAAIVFVLGILLLRYIKILYKGKYPVNSICFSVILCVCAFIIVIYMMRTALYGYIMRWIVELNLGLNLLLDVSKRILNFIYGPLFINIFSAQALYYPSYIASFVRLLATPVLIKGLLKFFKCENRNAVIMLLVLPFVISIVSLSVGKQDSAVRQYMTYYPLLCIIYGKGLTSGIEK